MFFQISWVQRIQENSTISIDDEGAQWEGREIEFWEVSREKRERKIPAVYQRERRQRSWDKSQKSWDKCTKVI